MGITCVRNFWKFIFILAVWVLFAFAYLRTKLPFPFEVYSSLDSIFVYVLYVSNSYFAPTPRKNLKLVSPSDSWLGISFILVVFYIMWFYEVTTILESSAFLHNPVLSQIIWYQTFVIAIAPKLSLNKLLALM